VRDADVAPDGARVGAVGCFEFHLALFERVFLQNFEL
jgi:hypothetical protein